MAESIHPALTRRDFLATSGSVLAASALPSAAPAQGATFRRWEITDPAMPARVLDSYKKGIRAMLAQPPTDPRNWYRNAFLHVFDCPHGNWWFLAWHRAYLGWLEQSLRAFSGDSQFALPYWDWTKTPRVPGAMFDDVLDPNNAAFVASFDAFRPQFDAAVTALFGTFSQPQMDALARRTPPITSPADFWSEAQQMFFDQPDARGLTAANPDLDPATMAAVSIGTVDSALATPTFSASGTDPAGFASGKVANHSDGTTKGILESQPHDNVHGAMGGQTGLAFMVSFLSPVDPIFFLHHGNLDRLWDVWNRRQAALNRPTLPQGADLTAWRGEQFLFFNDATGQPVSKTNAGDYAAMSAFDYDYSPGSGEDQVPTAGTVAAALPPPQTITAQITSTSIGAGEPAGGVAQVPAAALQAAAAQAPPRVVEVTLDLGSADETRRFRVMVAAGGGSPIVAGAITVFGHAHGPTTFTVPLPANITAGAAAGPLVPVDVRVVPIEHASGSSPSALAKTTARAARRSAAPPSRIAGITVRTS
jgi:tyrosinase